MRPVGLPSKPILFVTGHAPPDRIGAFRALHEREEVEFALFGGRSLHGGGPAGHDLNLPFPHRHVAQRQVAALAASGRYRAVIASTGGRVALPAAWLGARRARVPLILWSSLWAHPRTPAQILGYPLLARLYRSADAVVTYGSHVSSYVYMKGAKNVHKAPQSVDNDFWSAPGVRAPAEPLWPSDAHTTFLFVGRPAREKGLGVLVEAWRSSSLDAPTAALVLVGVGSGPVWVPAGGAVSRARARLARTERRGGEPGRRGGEPGRRDENAGAIVCLDPVSPVELRNFYASADVLVLPSIPTRAFREPWGLVVNEAMNRHLPVIVSDAVGAAAGGLVRDGRNGLVVPAGDSAALAGAMRRLAGDELLRRRMGDAGAADVLSYSHDAWARGFAEALASVKVSRSRW
jgi:glycosyltransferase involved in cell wall biosynthesis